MISIEYDQSDGYFSKLISLEKIIFNLDTKNIDESTQSIYDLFGAKYLNSVLLVISQLIYSSFSSQRKDFNLYFMFLKALDIKYEKITKYRTINIFIKYLQSLKSQESNYLLVKMFEQNMIDINVLIKKQCLYFVHYTKIDDIEDDFSDIFRRDIKIFRKNNWALHKKYIEEGHSPNEIAKIIRNDEEKKLQEISSQTNFDFNQTIEPSLYEIYSFINKRGVTLIDYAAFFGSVKCFKFLLLNGSNLKNTFKYAIAGDNLEIIHLCEQNHVSSKDVCKTAIKLHKSDVFEYFKGDLSYSNRFEEKCFLNNSYGILSHLLSEGSLFVSKHFIKKLLKKGNLLVIKNFKNYNFSDILLYYSIVESGNVELVEYFINNKNILNPYSINETNGRGKTALSVALKKGDLEIINLLLKHDKINLSSSYRYDYKTVLIVVCEIGNLEMVKSILKHKEIDINYINKKDLNGNTALIEAAEKGKTDIVKLLLEQKGIDINAKNNFGNTAFLKASENNHVETVKIFLETEEIDINEQDSNGIIPFIYASLNGSIELIKLFLEKGKIDINFADSGGDTALIYAACYGNTEIVKILLKQEGIDVNAKDNKWGLSALIYASKKNYIEIANLLVKHEKIDINVKDNKGFTALMWASYNGNKEIVNLLLEQKGIDINAKNNLGKTALNLASIRGHNEIIELLKIKETKEIK